MASEEAAANTETEEETIAVKKQKRSRRVSFADVEITSVHIFNRDDEDLSSSSSPNSTGGHPQKPLGLFSDLVDGDDFRDSSPNQHRNPFLRPLGSPSLSPSPFAASASSVDDGKFRSSLSLSLSLLLANFPLIYAFAIVFCF